MHERMKNKKGLCVVMPVYNEQEAIGRVLEKWDAMLRGLGCDYVIRPYNDGSKDSSLAVMRETAKKLGPQIDVRDKPNGGHGNTILTGYRDAVTDGFEWVFQIDSDDEMGPEKFADLWTRRGDYDFLVGTRDGRKQAFSRKLVSFVSRLSVKAFYGKGIWDVNTPYRLMRTSAFKDFFFKMPLSLFAPNVIISGLAARYGLRCFETPVPQHDRMTGEVSIKKWKLFVASVRSFFQVVGFSAKAPDIDVGTRRRSKCLKIGVAWLLAMALFAWLPGTFLNWGYNYLSFLPVWCTAAAFAFCFLLLAGPTDRIFPGLFSWPILKTVGGILLPGLAVLSFWLFRTKIHCFCGDGCVGSVPSGGPVSVSDFIPPFPGKGRLDGWGLAPLAKLLMQSGVAQGFTGMTMHFVSQVYSVVCGGVYVVLTLLLFRKSPGALCALFTFPSVLAFFGNIDCYAFVMCIGVVFAAAVASCNAVGMRGGLLRFFVAASVCVVGLWAHPFFALGGFALIPSVTRILNHIQRRVKIGEFSVLAVFSAVLFAVICSSEHIRPVFVWVEGGRPPIFSSDTLMHLLNIVILPVLPLMAAVWMVAERKEFSRLFAVFSMFVLCFLPLGFTQGANDQFVYMLFSFFAILPWVIWIAKNGLPRPVCRFVLAANLFLLIPMIAVHSSERTVARAEALYPIDPCKHNREMSWQTHLGLLLGDNIVDSHAVKSATLRIFANGARCAWPERFRGGNYLYHTAFLYHFGEFEKGRSQLFGLLRQDPGVVRYFMGQRPAFIYCNRKILWDDIESWFGKHVPGSYDAVRSGIAVSREKAQSEPFYVRRPKYAKSEY